MERISQNVWVETEFFGANLGVITTNEGLVLIDTPMNPSDQDRLLNDIKEKDLGAITWIIATDHHLDHFMGASFLPGKVISHQAVRGIFLDTFGPIEKIAERVSWSDPEGAERIKTLKVKEPVITFDRRLSLFFDPVSIHLESFVGHTPHTVAVRIEPDGVLFTGDNVVNGMPPFFHEAEKPLEWTQSLENINRLSFDTLVPGHGNVTDRETLYEMMTNVEDIIDKVRKALNRGGSDEDIQAKIRYLTMDTEHPSLKNFYRELEKRGIAHITRALK
jgi:glyoxylase-like metal-dependent hydrolase (beta-lactamase superfamily II)